MVSTGLSEIHDSGGESHHSYLIVAFEDNEAIAIHKMSDILMILGHAICVAQSLFNKLRLFPAIPSPRICDIPDEQPQHLKCLQISQYNDQSENVASKKEAGQILKHKKL